MVDTMRLLDGRPGKHGIMLERLLYDGVVGAQCTISGELSVLRESASCTSCINTIPFGMATRISPIYLTQT